ncbi:hypothetical protein TIFTF001_022288 [Ficus carica]|uniref:Uncharacterized protein n=1 Tax=Ficus carica TaxID=3494 RepID=A0AA88DEE2_FICCA|nr:hypothetical protein TIFTF001_022288 [Ficus carica]
MLCKLKNFRTLVMTIDNGSGN